MIGLFVADFDGRTCAVEWKDVHLPFDRNGSRHVAGGFVAGLIFQLAGDGDRFAVLAQRAPELCAGADLDILADAEGAFVDGDFFLDGGQIQSLRYGIGRGA